MGRWRKCKTQAKCLKDKLPDYTNEEMRERIDSLIHDAKDRALFKYKLIDGMTLESASEAADIPFSTARDHYYKYRKLLFANVSAITR